MPPSSHLPPSLPRRHLSLYPSLRARHVSSILHPRREPIKLITDLSRVWSFQIISQTQTDSKQRPLLREHMCFFAPASSQERMWCRHVMYAHTLTQMCIRSRRWWVCGGGAGCHRQLHHGKKSPPQHHNWKIRMDEFAMGRKEGGRRGPV